MIGVNNRFRDGIPWLFNVGHLQIALGSTTMSTASNDPIPSQPKHTDMVSTGESEIFWRCKGLGDIRKADM